MKNFTLKLLISTMAVMLGHLVLAQDQTIVIGSAEYTADHNYAVDTDDGPDGTTGSTYAWSIEEGVGQFPTGGTYNANTTDNKATINWDTVVTAGTYHIKVVETNNGCTADEVSYEVKIINPTDPVLNWDDPQAICSGDDATFTISGALPNSTITYTATGATTATGTVNADGSGNATIILTHDGTATQISVTLTQMNSVSINIGPITADVNIVVTSGITPLP